MKNLFQIRTRSGLCFHKACAVLLSVIVAAPGGLMAQQVNTKNSTYSGYKSSGGSLEGPSGVTEELSEDDVNTGAVLEFPKVQRFFHPWFDWKKRLNDKTGLKLQLSFQTLYQRTDQDVQYRDGFACRWQIQGSWELLNRGGTNPGKLTFRIENRYDINSAIPPSKLGYQFGSVTPTGTGFSDFGTALTELAWRQELMGGKLKFIFGKISAISWYNVHALSSSMRGFQNTAMQSSLSKPAPGRGIGFGIGYEFNPRFVMVAGIHDANAKTAENPFDIIGEKEFYKSVEFRYNPSTPDRWRWDQVRLQFWHQDALIAKGTPASQGVTFAASRLLNDKWYPFVLAGLSDGNASIFKKDVVAGLGVGFNTRHRVARDVLGVAVGWGDPSDAALQEQTTAELFYRFQLVEHLAITPSIQYVRNPAAGTTRDDALVFGLRARITY